MNNPRPDCQSPARLRERKMTAGAGGNFKEENMTADELKFVLEKHAKWLKNEDGSERANLCGANLRWAALGRADLCGADLSEADLSGADLRGADLSEANLRGANLSWANLSWANLIGADLSWADLRRADLSGADLRKADLRGADLGRADLIRANIDFSCWPLWCGSKTVKVDAKIARQLAAHFCVLDCDDQEYMAAREAILEFAKKSHRADDLGLVS